MTVRKRNISTRLSHKHEINGLSLRAVLVLSKFFLLLNCKNFEKKYYNKQDFQLAVKLGTTFELGQIDSLFDKSVILKIAIIFGVIEGKMFMFSQI